MADAASGIMRKILPLFLLVAGCSHGPLRVTGEIALGVTRAATRALFRDAIRDAIRGDRAPSCGETIDSKEPCVYGYVAPRRKATEREVTSIDRRPQI